MSTHKFEDRQVVRLVEAERLSSRHLSPTGLYEITHRMPQDQAGEFSYRLKSSAGERVVREAQILV